MIFDGNYTFFVNGESKTKEEVNEFIDSNMSVTISGTSVNFISPKKEIKKDEEKSYSFIVSRYGNKAGEEIILKESELERKHIDLIHAETIREEEKYIAYLESVKNHIENFAKKSKTEELLEEVNKHQEQNGGRVIGMEFPFDAILTPTIEEREQEIITAWERKDVQQYIEDWFKQPVYGTIGTPDDMKNKEIQDNGSMGFNFQKSQICAKENKTEGVKETEGKLNYELDWEFIQQMAERMSQNKGKYKPYNWKKLMDVEKLKQSLLRHTIEIMKGNYSDDGREYGHLESLADNAMMINYQLKNNKK